MKITSTKLQLDFYQRNDVVLIAKELLGKLLLTKFNGQLTGGIITETEAYAGTVDKASHAFNGRRTTRTEIMYAPGGIAYVYLCYGIHSLFNVVTSVEDNPHAVLIRSLFPLVGVKTILKRREMESLNSKIAAGPGTVSTALGIHYSNTGLSLLGNKIWIEDADIVFPKEIVNTSPRIGVDYAGEDAKLPYRFFIKWKDVLNFTEQNISKLAT